MRAPVATDGRERHEYDGDPGRESVGEQGAAQGGPGIDADHGPEDRGHREDAHDPQAALLLLEQGGQEVQGEDHHERPAAETEHARRLHAGGTTGQLQREPRAEHGNEPGDAHEGGVAPGGTAEERVRPTLELSPYAQHGHREGDRRGNQDELPQGPGVRSLPATRRPLGWSRDGAIRPSQGQGGGLSAHPSPP